MRGKLGVWLVFGTLVNIPQSPILWGWAQAPQAAVRAQGEDADPLSIVIWVYNYPHVPNRTLAEAENAVARIFARAGISAEWIQCPVSAEEVQARPACQERMSEKDLALVTLPQSNAATRRNSDTYFGSAQVFTNGQFGHYAYVFYDRVEDPANRGEASVSQVLADIAAHELGHVLLRSSAHAASGLMRARWDKDDLHRAAQGQLLFTPNEAERIRAEVRARMEASARMRKTVSSIRSYQGSMVILRARPGNRAEVWPSGLRNPEY